MKHIITHAIFSVQNYIRAAIASGVLGLFIMPSVAIADVKTESEIGFSILHVADVSAEPDEIWETILLPRKWWSEKHSFSGKAENFYLEPKVNGCFCESLTDESADGTAENNGEVEHMRIILIDNEKALRMKGALGPLQSEAVNATLSIAMKANGDGTTRMSFSYVVGGYMRYKVGEISGPINIVIGEQFNNLVNLWDPVAGSDAATASGISLSDDAKIISNDANDEDADEGSDEDLTETSDTDEQSDEDILPKVVRER